ncbi:hypothetical protein [Rubripirellula reticaptiva]|nr:hypothetical protein [Rubripirellula reticaptiva]
MSESSPEPAGSHQRRKEQSILIAVIVIPVLLGLVINGWQFVIAI